MARNKDPAVLFYTADFLASTTLFTNEELGAYIKLLCIQHLQDGLSESEIASVRASDRVRFKFKLCADGLYRNERMADEKRKRSAYAESRRQNIAKRYEKHTESTYVQHMNNICASSEVHMGNENINTNKDIDIDNKKIESEEEEKKKKEEKKSQTDIYIERFERFWKVYPQKVGKGEARKAFVKHQPSEKLTETMVKAVETAKKSVQWTKDGGKYIPNPSTWLNQERWEDELTAAPEAVSEQKSEVDKWFEEVYMEGAFKR